MGLVAILSAYSAPATAAPSRNCATLDLGGPVVIGLALNTWSTFVELQTGVSKRVSLIGEVGYLASNDFRALGGGSTDLSVRLSIFTTGAAIWVREPFDGPFVSVRGELWLATARDRRNVVAVGNQYDANLQPGWQWDLGGFTLIASASLAYVTGPVESADGTVAFPLHGFSATPHLRLGYVW